MICQRMMVGGGGFALWQYTINTEATTANAIDGAVPVNLINSQAKFVVDWGDGTEEVFTGTQSWSAPVHSYDTPGIYQISVKIDKPETVYIMANVNGGYIDGTYGKPYRIMRDTLISVDKPIPAFAGVVDKNKSNLTSGVLTGSFNRLFYEHGKLTVLPSPLFEESSYITSLQGLFYKCTSLSSVPDNFLSGMTNLSTFTEGFRYTGITTIPETLLKDCPKNTDISSLFANCQSLSEVPEDIIKKQTEITRLYGFLYMVDIDFSINIYAPNISNMVLFTDQSNPNNRSRVVHVIPGSTTESTFLANASSYHITVISDLIGE